MKSIFLTITTTLLISTSCYAQKEKLALNLVKGETYCQRLVANMSLVQGMNGQKMNIKIGMNGKTNYKVINVVDSVYDIEVKYENLAMNMNLPTGHMEFSSEKNDPNDIFSKVLGAMKKNAFFIKMTKSGKVLEVKNIENLFNAFNEFPQLSTAQKEQIKTQLSQTYGEKAFKGTLEMSMSIFPSLPVAKGDKWTIKGKLESGMSADLETIYELKEITSEYYVLSGTAKISTPNKDEYGDMNGMPMKYDLKGTMTSDLKVSKKTGWIIDAKIDQNISGTTQLKDNPKLPGGMTLPMAMSNKMIITDK